MFISLRTQFENLGDLLINSAAIDIAGQHGAVVGSTLNVPAWYEGLLKESGVLFLPSKSVFALFEDADRVILLKPGGYGGVMTSRDALKSLAHTIYLAIAKCAGFRVVQMPSSKGKTRAPFDLAERLRLGMIDRVWARDAETQVSLAALGARVDSCPDLAVHFHDTQSIFSSTVSESLSIARSGMVFSFRGDRQDNAINRVELVRAVLGEIPTAAVSQVFFDDAHNEALSRHFCVPLVKYVGTTASILAVREVYRRAKYIVSDRLHVLLMAALNGAIPVALVSERIDRKVIACMAQMGICNVIIYDGVGDVHLPNSLLNNEEIQTVLAGQKRILRSTSLLETAA